MARPKKDPETIHQKFSVSFEPEMLKELLEYCERNERTVSWVVRKALAEWMPKHKDDKWTKAD